MNKGIDYEVVAKQIHTDYCNSLPPGTPYQEYHALEETMKDTNRVAAQRIGRVLRAAEMRLAELNGPAWSDADQSLIRSRILAHLDRLAEAEHDGWIEERLDNGWKLGPIKDVPKREHHLLVPWKNFPEAVAKKQEFQRNVLNEEPAMSVDEEVVLEKNRDRNSVRRYVDIIAATPYRIEVMK